MKNEQSASDQSPPDTTKAERWRSQFVGALRAERLPGVLHRELVAGIEDRAWTRLVDERGKPFRSFGHFCRSPQPFGLELAEDDVRAFLERLLGKRRAKLALVKPGTQGQRPEETSGPEGTRHDKRLRAIAERAPAELREAYELGLMTAKEVETHAHSSPDASRAAETSRLVASIGPVLQKARQSPDQVKGLRAEVRESIAQSVGEAQAFVYSASVGTNADVFPGVLQLHVLAGARIADVTWGRGAFWARIDDSEYDVVGSDVSDGIDLRDLPYDDASMDAVVLDPPYQWSPSGGTTTGGVDLEDRYRNAERVTISHEAVVQLYVDGAREALRVLRPDGLLIIKCQDECCSGGQRLTHVELINELKTLGLECDDLFVVVQRGRPMVRAGTVQRHARKNHSYFLVFRRGQGVSSNEGKRERKTRKSTGADHPIARKLMYALTKEFGFSKAKVRRAILDLGKRLEEEPKEQLLKELVQALTVKNS